MENAAQNENTPIEMIEGRLKRLRTNEIDGRDRLRLREEEGWEGWENKTTWDEWNRQIVRFLNGVCME